MLNLVVIGFISIIYSYSVYGQDSLFDNIDVYYDDQFSTDNDDYIFTDTDQHSHNHNHKSTQSNNNAPNLMYVSNSTLPEYRNTKGKKTVVVNIGKQAFGAYDSDGYLIKSGRVSTGKRGYRTKRGTFSNLQKRGGANCWSYKYEVGMPYCMFYSGGFALHGYHDVPNYPASRGCVRMLVDDARWLHNSFVDSSTILIVR